MLSKLFRVLETRHSVFGLVALLACGALVYANSLSGAFVFDDIYNIRDNPFIQDLRFFWSYFTDYRTLSALPENAPYRPLSTVSFAFLWAIGNGSVWVFHVHKILMHVLIAWMSLRIGMVLVAKEGQVDRTAKASLWLGALLFVIHPALSEAVNYSSSLTSVQCAVFYVAAFWAFLGKKFFLMALLALASMLTKEEGASFPAVILLYSWVYKDWKRDKRSYGIAFGVLFAYLAVRHLLGSRTVIFGTLPWYEYFFTQLRAWVYYIYKIFTPWGYSVEHHSFGFSKSLFEPAVLGSAVLILASLLKTYRWARPGDSEPGRPFLAFGMGWYIICLLPASSFFPLSEPINEHRYYLSFALFLPALVLGISAVRESSGVSSVLQRLPVTLKTGAILAVLLVFSSVTIHQNRIWRTEETLWSDVVAKDPGNGRALNNLGIQIMSQGKLAEALDLFIRSEKMAPGYKYALINQVICLVAMHRIPEAREVIHRLSTAAVGADSVVVHHHHAKFLFETEGKPAEALPVIERCNELADRKFLPCLVMQIWIYQDLNRAEDMIRAAREVQRVQPENRDGKFGEGLGLIRLQRYPEAQVIFDELSFRNPNDIQALHNAAWIRFQLGNYRESKERWEQKLMLAPKDFSALSYLKAIAEKTTEQP